MNSLTAPEHRMVRAMNLRNWEGTSIEVLGPVEAPAADVAFLPSDRREPTSGGSPYSHTAKPSA